MGIELSFQSSGLMTYAKSDKEIDLKDKKVSAKEISTTYLMEYQLKISQESKENFDGQVQAFRLSDIGYTGKPIAELSQDEAKALVAEDGFFGIVQTSERIANFVLNGSGDNLERLQAGRRGMLQGFKEAEALWGEKLPEISYTTMEKALAMVDARISELGGSVLDTSV